MKVLYEETHKKIEAFCAPAYTTDCLYKHSSAVATAARVPEHELSPGAAKA